MINIYIDTNILIDYFIPRNDHSVFAINLMDQIYSKKCKFYISALSICNFHYLVKKLMNKDIVAESILTMLKDAEIIALTDHIIKQSVESKMTDFEDAIQYYSAKSIKDMKFIVTRDPKGFRKSEIPVYDPRTATNILKQIQFS